jgi:hypothetical protein
MNESGLRDLIAQDDSVTVELRPSTAEFLMWKSQIGTKLRLSRDPVRVLEVAVQRRTPPELKQRYRTTEAGQPRLRGGGT